MNTFKNENSLRTTEAQIVQKVKNNEARPKFTGSYIKNKPAEIYHELLNSILAKPVKCTSSPLFHVSTCYSNVEQGILESGKS